MPELSTILERESQSVDLLPGGFERLLRRRDRKERNRRVATAVFALVLALVAIGGAIRALSTGERHLPARPVITPENVSDLRVNWTANIGGPPSGHEVGGHHGHQQVLEPFAPAVGPDRVYVSTGQGEVVAYQKGCGSGGAGCSPSWTASLGGSAGPAVATDSGVVVATSSGTLVAFDAGCGTGVASCTPSWTAELGPLASTTGIPFPVVGGSDVYVTNGDTLFAFDAVCRTDGTDCQPAWSASTRVALGVPVISGSTVYVAGGEAGPDRVLAFDARTGTLLWKGFAEQTDYGNPGAYQPVVGDGVVAMTFHGVVHVFPESCRSDGGTCRPLWIARPPDPLANGPVIANRMVLVKSWSKPEVGHLSAFALGCGTGGAECTPEWTSQDLGWGDIFTSDDFVYSTGFDRREIVAYPVACGSDGGSCQAAWRARGLGVPLDYYGRIAGNGLVFVPTESGTVYAFDANCGGGGGVCEPAWTFRDTEFSRARRQSVSPPSIDGTHLYLATVEGKLFAFGLPSGRETVASPGHADTVTLGAVALLLGLIFFVLRRRRI